MMDREKQIEEMTDTINDMYGVDAMYFGVDSNAIAHHLYEAGYRKQSEGEWIKHTDEYDCEYFECSNCHEEFYPPYDEFAFDIIPKHCQECGAKMKGGTE